MPIEIHPGTGPNVEGFIPRVENTPESRIFLDLVRPPYAMMNLSVVRELLDTGITADECGTDATSIITTSTINDNLLYNMPIEEEAELIKAFDPTYHIPSDQSIYARHTPAERETQLERLIQGTAEMHLRLASTEVSLLPLIKGIDHGELEQCFNALDELGAQTVVFYATQYFTGGQPNTGRCKEMLRRIGDLLGESQSLIIVGAAGETLWEAYPENTTAIASWHAWFSLVKAYFPPTVTLSDAVGDPTETLPPEAIDERYAPFVEDLHTALNVSIPFSYRLEWHQPAE